jgi:hypothetical protein
VNFHAVSDYPVLDHGPYRGRHIFLEQLESSDGHVVGRIGDGHQATRSSHCFTSHRFSALLSDPPRDQVELAAQA